MLALKEKRRDHLTNKKKATNKSDTLRQDTQERGKRERQDTQERATCILFFAAVSMCFTRDFITNTQFLHSLYTLNTL